MDRGFATGELDELRVALGLDEVVQDVLDILERQVEARACVGEAKRTGHVAGAVDLDDAHAGMLLVVRAEAAVVGAALGDLGRKGERDGARLVELRRRRVGLGIAVDERLVLPVLGAAFAHVDLVVAQEDVRVDHAAALGADAARELVEDVVGVVLRVDARAFGERIGHLCLPACRSRYATGDSHSVTVVTESGAVPSRARFRAWLQPANEKCSFSTLRRPASRRVPDRRSPHCPAASLTNRTHSHGAIPGTAVSAGYMDPRPARIRPRWSRTWMRSLS